MPREPRFRAVPPYLRSSRVSSRDYARFYGLYTTLTGATRRFSFQVRADSLRNMDKYKSIVATVNRLHDMIPTHVQGQIFSGFPELFRGTTWFRIRRLNMYKAGVLYER
jgi:hypothetical protein